MAGTAPQQEDKHTRHRGRGKERVVIFETSQGSSHLSARHFRRERDGKISFELAYTGDLTAEEREHAVHEQLPARLQD
jgi:hypothetical protein